MSCKSWWRTEIVGRCYGITGVYTVQTEKDGYFLYIFYVVGGFFTDNQRFCQSVSQQFQGSSGVCRYVWSESCQCIDIFVAGVGNIVYLINTVCVEAFRNQACYADSHVGMGTSFRIVRTGESWAGCLDVCTVHDCVWGAFDFFNISGSLFVNNETDLSIRSSAQGLFVIMTNGIGATVGTLGAQAVVNRFVDMNSSAPQMEGWSMTWFVFAGYALAVAVLFAVIFKYKHRPGQV